MIAIRRSVLLVILTLPAALEAQKRALTQADWDRWRSISGATLSNDGKWAAYTLAPLVGDGELVIRATSRGVGGATEYRIPRGYLGRPNNVPGALRPRAGANPEEEPGGPSITPAQLTADSRFALALVYPPQAEFDNVRRDRRRTATLQNRSELAIVRLADGNVTSVSRVRSFRLPRSSGAWVAYVVGDSAATDSAAGRAGAAGQQAGGRGEVGAGGRGGGGAPEPRRRYGSTVVLRDMASGAEERIADVRDFAFDDSARVFAYAVVSRTPGRDGVYARNLSSGATATLLGGTGDYNQITLDRAGSQVAFVSNRDEFGKDDARFALYHASLKDGGARPAVTPAALGEMQVAENANVAFTRAGNAVVFGITTQRADTLPADSLIDRSVFDLWHHRDPRLQPSQRLTAGRDRNRSFQALYHVGARRFVRLANDSIPQVTLSADGRIAFASSGERYAVRQMWGDDGDDLYLIDGMTGRIRMIREKITGNAQLSPDAKYVAFFDAGRWFTYAIATGRVVEVTASIEGVSFARETHDRPSPPPAWGIAGWTKADRSLLLYDRWDIWEVDPTGARAPVMVTDSRGRKTSVTLRLAIGGGGGGGGFGGGGFGGGFGDDRAIDPAKPLILRGVNDETRSQGFVREQLGITKEPELIVVEDAAFGNLIKARDAEQYLVTKGTFVDFPNLYTGASLASLRRISDANPQQSEYNWGTVELVRWTSGDGVPLKGLLFKPENFDSTKKYPMVTYFYEQLSQNRHTYVPPNGRNVINPTHYVSNGYLVFEPDIHYEMGYPGPSAMKAIVPGVQMLLARGFVDPKGLGIQGQSWGGYQTTYMITQTRLFSAAMAGAPVSNMTSAYGGIRWGSGLARPFMYETGQSRIGGSIWENTMRYIENSPLFWIDKTSTPLLIMHNDADDAVPWYQGIELFVAMRRLGKEVYLINYNNDVHNPQSRANQKDIAMRMQQFFDHHLRGMPAPDWMTKGIPYLAKGRDQVPGVQVPVQAGHAIPQSP